jgi:hypothetical protein
MWRLGSTAQTELAAKKNNRKQIGNDRKIFNAFAFEAKFSLTSSTDFTSDPEILSAEELT